MLLVYYTRTYLRALKETNNKNNDKTNTNYRFSSASVFLTLLPVQSYAQTPTVTQNTDKLVADPTVIYQGLPVVMRESRV